MFLGCLYIQKVILYEVVMEKILEKGLGMVQGVGVGEDKDSAVGEVPGVGV